MKPKRKLPYYNYSKLLSFNAVYHMCVGGRGLGKTYGAKKLAIRDAIKKGEQFIYLRRYSKELAAARDSFFADIVAQDEFKTHDFRINGNKAEMAPIETRDEKKRQWSIIGYFKALSTAQNEKSVSFPLVTKIIFDEFIIEKGASVHYLSDESNTFDNFFNTVDRNQDKTKVFFLANAVSIMNPYFMRHKIRPDECGEWSTLYKQEEGYYMVVHFPDAEDFKNAVMLSRFGRYIEGTEYADYAVGNQFKDNSDGLIGQKTPDARYLFTLETKQVTMSIWREKDIYFAQQKLPLQQTVVTLVPELMEEGKILAQYNEKMFQLLRAAFKRGRVFFDNPATRNGFIEIGKR